MNFRGSFPSFFIFSFFLSFVFPLIMKSAHLVLTILCLLQLLFSVLAIGGEDEQPEKLPAMDELDKLQMTLYEEALAFYLHLVRLTDSSLDTGKRFHEFLLTKTNKKEFYLWGVHRNFERLRDGISSLLEASQMYYRHLEPSTVPHVVESSMYFPAMNIKPLKDYCVDIKDLPVNRIFRIFVNHGNTTVVPLHLEAIKNAEKQWVLLPQNLDKEEFAYYSDFLERYSIGVCPGADDFHPSFL